MQIQRILENCQPEPNTGCRLWLGSGTWNGYGHVKIGGETRLVHRTVWEHFNGPIPTGLCVLHTCDCRSCANPSHLFLGTCADNMADKVAKGRQWKKVTGEDVALMRSAYAAGGVCQRELGEAFGITQSQVSYIVNGKRR